jgi:hypothetical protein
MAINILDSVRSRLGYTEIRKVDPNTQEAKREATLSTSDRLAQAALPAVLTALYHHLGSELRLSSVFDGSGSDLLQKIFGERKDAAVQRVAAYSGVDVATAENEMNKVAATSISTIRENISDKASPEAMKAFLAGQKNSILSHLPAALQMGELLNDDALDDRTHKMGGPVSSVMRKIEDIFSRSTRADENI